MSETQDDVKDEVIHGLLLVIRVVNLTVTAAAKLTQETLPETSAALATCQEVMDKILSRHPMIADVMPDEEVTR